MRLKIRRTIGYLCYILASIWFFYIGYILVDEVMAWVRGDLKQTAIFGSFTYWFAKFWITAYLTFVGYRYTNY